MTEMDEPEIPDWSELSAWAERVVENLVDTLPERLRGAARSVPVLLEPEPSPELVQDGIDPETLGLFVGADFAEGDGAILPPHIVLYLGNLWLASDGDRRVFEEEIRTTWLHEIGHYLGLDEDDLESRGLE